MDGSKKGGVEGGVGTVARQAAGKKQSVDGEEDDVGEHKTCRNCLANFGWITPPPAKTLVENRQRGKHGSDGIEFAGSSKSESGDEDEEKQRGAVKPFRGGGSGRNGKGRCHGRRRRIAPSTKAFIAENPDSNDTATPPLARVEREGIKAFGCPRFCKF